jgi:hypothetical protein
VITNGSFQQAGGASGLATGWTLRSACAREAIAPFHRGSIESFETWVAWSADLGNAAAAPIAPSGRVETFDAWPAPLFALELSAGLVAATLSDGFSQGWWQGTAAFQWGDVAAVPGVFAGGARSEAFDAWLGGGTYLVAFPASALSAGPFAGGAVELFTAWTMKNTTLG